LKLVAGIRQDRDDPVHVLVDCAAGSALLGGPQLIDASVYEPQ
jgi:hypothetical protein